MSVFSWRDHLPRPQYRCLCKADQNIPSLTIKCQGPMVGTEHGFGQFMTGLDTCCDPSQADSWHQLRAVGKGKLSFPSGGMAWKDMALELLETICWQREESTYWWSLHCSHQRGNKETPISHDIVEVLDRLPGIFSSLTQCSFTYSFLIQAILGSMSSFVNQEILTALELTRCQVIWSLDEEGSLYFFIKNKGK